MFIWAKVRDIKGKLVPYAPTIPDEGLWVQLGDDWRKGEEL